MTFEKLIIGALIASAVGGVDAKLDKETELPFNSWLKTQSNVPHDLEKRYIVKFKNSPAVALKKADGEFQLNAMKAQTLMASVGAKVRKELTHLNAVSVVMGKQSLSKLAKLNSIDYIEIDEPRQLSAQYQPWGISSVEANMVSDNLASNTKVCIIDSGYQANHPDLLANNHDGTNDSGTGNWFEPGGSHGTHVAGTIAAVNNNEGVVGVLPNQHVGLHIVKVFNESGWGYSSELAEAVNVCANNGAKVINMSLGGGRSTTTEANALQTAYDNGILLVAASGNSGNDTLSYPASYDSVIAVGAVDENEQWAHFSQYTNQVELSAPGEAILSTVALNDGVQSYISTSTMNYGDDDVVPLMRFVSVNNNYEQRYFEGAISGELAACNILSNGNYDCANVNNKICLIERKQNQYVGKYYEAEPVSACLNNGARAVIVYSTADKPGLQNPFLVDENNQFNFVAVSVSRALGESLRSRVGETVNVSTITQTNYAYYNGTSMASPHVSGVAALVWSQFPECTNIEIRAALVASAKDIDNPGRDVRTGYGLVQSKAAVDYLTANPCGDIIIEDFILQNSIPKSGLNLSRGYDVFYTMEVPDGATNINFSMSGGSGDADLFVKFGSEPTDGSYDCRPYKTGNNESCSGSQTGGTYYVRIKAYRDFSNVTLTGSFIVNDDDDDDDSEDNVLVNGQVIAELSAAQGEELLYVMDVPEGAQNIQVVTSGGSGDSDLYIKFGSPASDNDYDCRPYRTGNDETCSVSSSGGRYFVRLKAYRNFSGVSLVGRFSN
ncbi:MAG: S8 family serine peptidase [Gammaproteobacteria bacterium]|nr:S8 family serine peptidase [Gammaproteobacteria bacterium]